MNSKYLSAAAALLCVAGLSACGGSGNGSIPLAVQVRGLDRSGLIMQNNGGDDLAASTAGLYTFKTLMAPDSAFKVTVKENPSGVVCVESNNTGKINYYSYQQSIVTCTPVPYFLGGKVVGLKGSGLVLANGAQNVGVQANADGSGGDVNWQFNEKINNGAVYGVTVLTQPKDPAQVCSVANGTSTMPQANVTNVTVTCQ